MKNMQVILYWQKNVKEMGNKKSYNMCQEYFRTAWSLYSYSFYSVRLCTFSCDTPYTGTCHYCVCCLSADKIIRHRRIMPGDTEIKQNLQIVYRHTLPPRMNKWMNELTNGQTDGWTNERITLIIIFSIRVSFSYLRKKEWKREWKNSRDVLNNNLVL